ncbi:bifunctional acetate--CoA ligase family protein/GNAT family N-acetyltransferase [Rhizobium sp. FKL33]|uniref:bifunctional acetate--CoA ligase family protein/GNAT family N-acetyltransferase n=1 Tax=Rhizobium sp. FKL33 TaxID=2562307 RepID=UPI0010C013F6|nr:bifunctional acetate--CoA ligase family protein/GNAT family N-acetyltransferase [Rhizobium sp. FKL33]
MTIRNLDAAFDPRAIAVIGASDREGSVGAVVLANILSGGFAGAVYPVNPKYSRLRDLECRARVADLPEAPDLAVICTPPATVPGLIGELAARGCRAAVVITAGVSAASGLKQAMLTAARPHLFRIFGPNTVGLILPHARLNASFAHRTPAPGGVALISQSGAIVTSLIDWAAGEGVGLSAAISLGDMADVDAADCLDMLSGDPNTRVIVMYLESIAHPRKFMSAARAAARIKPVIAIKPGRHAAAAKAAATHTGALSGADRVTEAALNRAGVLRVRALDQLFDAVEVLSRFEPMPRIRTGLVTNGGGAGVLAVDRLMDWKGDLADLSTETIAALDATLPPNWSRANPVDIIGDAPPERYVEAVKAVARDPGVDAIVVMNCPTALASPIEAARAVAALAVNGRIEGKPTIACWLGEETAREGRAVLRAAGVAVYAAPEAAADAIGYLGQWSQAQAALSRVPEASPEIGSEARAKVAAILRAVANDGRTMLGEVEAKSALSAYGLPTPETLIAATPEDARAIAEHLLERGGRLVVKLQSRTITHKSDVGGVILGVDSADAAVAACREIERRLTALGQADAIDGYAIQPMIERPHAHELIVGASLDSVFGPVILFGAGGTAVEALDDATIGLPPLDAVLSGDLIDATRINRLLKGYRDRKPADRAAIIDAIQAVSALTADFGAIRALDVNPLLADEDGVIALDARIEIDPSRLDEPAPNRALAIRPYPGEWAEDVDLGPLKVHIRPIRPDDLALYGPFFARISDEDLRLRFLSPRRHFPDQMLKRLTQLDYDREIAFVALDRATGDLMAIGRLNADPDKDKAEYALLVRSDLQGHGLGWTLLRRLIDYARADGVCSIEGVILAENDRMLQMAREFGFAITRNDEDLRLMTAALTL